MTQSHTIAGTAPGLHLALWLSGSRPLWVIIMVLVMVLLLRAERRALPLPPPGTPSCAQLAPGASAALLQAPHQDS